MPLLRPCRLAAALLLLASAAAPARAQAPDASWRTIETEHFRVHYAEGLEPLAREAAARAEVAREQLAQALVEPPRGRIDVVVADDADYANGFARIFPYNHVVVYAHPPVDDPTLSFYDDWIALVVSHELVHVFHLDHARGPLGGLRRVLGRHPVTFPSAQVPDWTVEGLATYLESRVTRAGRVRGTMHEMALRTAILEGRFHPIDRASGDPVAWPAGATRYVYGSLFIDWLARRHGHDRAGELVRRVGRSLVPYRLDHHARQVYGRSFTTLWDEWRAELEGRSAALADSLRREGLTEPRLLTPEGRSTSHPRWSPDGAWIAYAAQSGRAVSSTRRVRADGGGEEEDVEVIERRTTLGPSAWAPDGRSLLTAQIDLVDPYRQHSDLYRVGIDGAQERLTRRARLLEPDLSPDGRTAVAVRSVGGAVGLVAVDLASGTERVVVPPSREVHWSLPRWSPDGARIAAARWRQGGFLDVVVLDAATGRVLRELTSDRAVDAAPAWSPDGRYVLFSSDRTGIANLYAADAATGELRQVTNVLTGAFHPDVSPDGGRIAFTLYRADGYHVATLPFAPSAWRPAPPVRPEVAVPADGPAPPPAEAPSRPYSPWRSLLPRAWSPTFATSGDALGWAAGAGIASEDVVGRHAYGLYAEVYPRSDFRLNAGLAYSYRGLGNPVLGLSAYQDWDEAFASATVAGSDGLPVPSAILERERAATVSATLARPRFHSYAWLSGGVNLRGRERVWDRPAAAGVFALNDVPLDLGGVVSAGISTAQTYEYSISPERGGLLSVSAQGRRYLEPFAGDDEAAGYSRLLGRAQAFQPFRLWGYARHVLALRVAAGGEHGSRAPGLEVGGAGGLGSLGLAGGDLGLGESLDFPVRGYDEGAQRGDRAFSATAEYRYPIALVERGWRLVPAWLDRLWGTAFADAGAAWCVEACTPGLLGESERVRPLYSVGAELGVQLRVGYDLPLTLRGGLAVPLSGVEVRAGEEERPAPSLYVRLGRSF